MNRDDNYLNKEEERCGFLVSAKRKKVWQRELELFELFKSICKKHELQYFLMAGSLLGAVRHKGFIPWDDDMDVAMMREDYDKFCAIAESEIDYPFEIQIAGKSRFCNCTKICNSATIALDIGVYNTDSFVNQGIFLDIFPIDAIPSSRIKRTVFRIVGKLLFTIRNSGMINEFNTRGRGVKVSVRHLTSRLFGLLFKVYPHEKFSQMCERYMARYNSCAEENLGNLCFFISQGLQNEIWNKKLLLEFIEVPFEDTTARVPASFDEVLKVSYGEWRKFVMGGSMHEGLFFDPDRPYKDYVREQNKIKKSDCVL